MKYDGTDRLKKLSDANGLATVAERNYQFNTANQVTLITDSLGDHSYQYDALGRLTSVVHPDESTETYGYDGVGNRTTSGASSYSYDPFNRLTSDGVNSYSYDANGNMTSGAAGSTYQ